MEESNEIRLKVDNNRKEQYPLHHTRWLPNHFVTNAREQDDATAIIASADEMMLFAYLTESEERADEFMDHLQSSLLANGIIKQLMGHKDDE